MQIYISWRAHKKNKNIIIYIPLVEIWDLNEYDYMQQNVHNHT